MRQILHSYKLRLTNLSQGNRSLKLGRLSSRRDADVRDLGYIEKFSPEELLERLIAGKKITIINRLDPRHEKLNIADRRLNRIYRQARMILEETGTYDLFVGYPFIEGKFIDGTVARCPLLLFPVRLQRDLRARPRWVLENLTDEPIQFNKTFFLAYEQFQQMRMPPEFWEEEVERSKDWQAWLNNLYELFKKYELDINFNQELFEMKLKDVLDYRKAEMEERFGMGKLKLESQAVLGIFPQSDSALLQDYEKIEQQPEQFDVGQYFPVDESEMRVPYGQEDEQYIREEDRFFVTPLDQSQEEALLKMKRGRSVVLHGPPGTGKSQVIVNIIADAMAHGKKVLVVSQKRVALDVVYKRLSAMGLGRFAVLVHDYRHDRKAIYEKIRLQIEAIDEFKKEINDLNVTRWQREFNQLSRQSDQLYHFFDQLHQTLQQKSKFGISPHELYLTTNQQADILPLENIAPQFDLSKLEDFLDKFRELLDYADIFDDRYPWHHRLSFRHYSYTDQQHIQSQLQELPEKVARLNRKHQELAEIAPHLLNIELNEKRIATFHEVEELLSHYPIRRDIEAIHKDQLEAEKVLYDLEKLESILQEIDRLNMLRETPWSLFLDLRDHAVVYEANPSGFGRFLSLSFLKARWFIQKILDQHQRTLDHYPELASEIKVVNKLFAEYSRWDSLDFFEDFPIHSSHQEQKKWIEQKREHIKAYEVVEGMAYLKSLKPEFPYGQLNETKWKDAQEKVRLLERYHQTLQDSFRDWNRFLHPDQIDILKAGIEQNGLADDFMKELLAAFQQDFSELKTLDTLLSHLSIAETEIIQQLDPIINKETEPDAFAAQVKNSIFFFWQEQLEREHPVLLEVSSRGFERKMKEFERKLSDRRDKVVELIHRKVKESICDILEYNRLKNPVTYRRIYHQVSKKRMLWSVRKLVSESWEKGLNRLMPCWMASPESASAIFPMERGFFDVVVFDEASQCFVERAIPVLLRGKQAVVAGDDKQLPPFNMYKIRYEDAEEEFNESDMAMEVESILDLSKNTLEEYRLSWHYRSQEEELINFSNHAFYDGKLQVIPKAENNPINYPPLEWVPIRGVWENNTNRAEAEGVIALISELVMRDDRPSIGIVTFNFHQQELIKDLLEQKLMDLASTDTRHYELLHEAMNKEEEEEFMGIFVKNIENVQGDERDIIVFSIGYARNPEGRLITNFGLLNQKGGENRLNVAITRAKQKVFVLCSFDPLSLQVENAKNAGPRLFKNYLQYVKAISENREMEAESILNQQTEYDISIQPENPIATEIAMELRKAGYYVIENFGDTQYKLDLAVKAAKQSDSFLLGIECEGHQYFSGINPKEREVYRRGLLRSRGWKLHRVWARNYQRNKKSEIEKILRRLQEG